MNTNKSKLNILTIALLALSTSGYAFAASEAEVEDFKVPAFMEKAAIKTQSNIPLFDDSPKVSKADKSNTNNPSSNSATQVKNEQNKDVSKNSSLNPVVGTQTQKLDELTTKSNLGVLELTILNQELQKKELLKKLHSDEINELINLAKSEAEEEFKVIEDSYISEINSLRNENQRLKGLINSKSEKSNNTGSENLSNTNIFVTEISGIGRNLEAKVYYNGGSTITVHEGSVFGNNIEVIKIDRAGLLLNINNKQSYLTVDDEDYAFSKMYVSDTK